MFRRSHKRVAWRCAPTGCGVLQSASAFLTPALWRGRAEGRPEHQASSSASASASAAAALTDCEAALQRRCKKRVGAGTCPCLNPAAFFLLGIFGEEAVLLQRVGAAGLRPVNSAPCRRSAASSESMRLVAPMRMTCQQRKGAPSSRPSKRSSASHRRKAGGPRVSAATGTGR